MGSLYYDLATILRNAGCTVNVNEWNAGWERRARSSGGFSSPPLCVFWHHTASSTSVQNDLNYMIYGNQDAPVGNLLIDREGGCWPIAGGASNCAGKGNAMTFSRGTGAKDSGNTWGFQIEVQNNGVGEAWSEATVDAFFRASNALNAAVGNQPTDVTTHALGDGTGYTDRKIDPAVASAVQGDLWWPDAVNGSGTWSLPQIREECAKRAGAPVPVPPDPTPPDPTPPSSWPASLTSTLPVLYQGVDNYWMVRRMQHLLCATGYMNEANPANYDGKFGSGTANALTKWQQAAGLQANGACDGDDWAALCGPMPNLYKGNSGYNVKVMQHLLAACGFMNEANVSNYDGKWGSGTEQAKINHDNAAGLVPSPPTDCGPKSWTALLTY